MNPVIGSFDRIRVSSVLKNTLLVSRQDVASIYRARKCLINGGAPRPRMAEGGKKRVQRAFFNRLLVAV